jgi:4-hydroxy-tetrahydrodipicolinate reductase
LKIKLFGRGGKVGSVLAPALEAKGHELVELPDADSMVDFTAPEVAAANVMLALQAGVPCVVGTSGWETAEVARAAEQVGLPVFYAPNFAIGAVLMMSFAEAAAEYLPRTEIVELHGEAKKDAPSGTARATAERLPGEPPIHSVRLPGLVAHQEVLLGGEGQLLTIRHDTFSREAFVPGVLLALEKLKTLPPGLTVGLERLLDSR